MIATRMKAQRTAPAGLRGVVCSAERGRKRLLAQQDQLAEVRVL